jgi:malate dehydrogenase (oxaloacetate-decarboxylating)(NADP+)
MHGRPDARSSPVAARSSPSRSAAKSTRRANNSFIFPGVGLGVLVSRASRVTDSMFSAAAAALAGEVTADDLAAGRIYPPQNRMRDVARAVATAVANVAYDEGLATAPRPAELAAEVTRAMYWPEYVT